MANDYQLSADLEVTWLVLEQFVYQLSKEITPIVNDCANVMSKLLNAYAREIFLEMLF